MHQQTLYGPSRTTWCNWNIHKRLAAKSLGQISIPMLYLKWSTWVYSSHPSPSECHIKDLHFQQYKPRLSLSPWVIHGRFPDPASWMNSVHGHFDVHMVCPSFISDIQRPLGIIWGSHHLNSLTAVTYDSIHEQRSRPSDQTPIQMNFSWEFVDKSFLREWQGCLHWFGELVHSDFPVFLHILTSRNPYMNWVITKLAKAN